MSEYDGEDQHCDQRLQDHPAYANGSLLVPDFDLPPDQKVQQLAILPQRRPIHIEETASILDDQFAPGGFH